MVVVLFAYLGNLALHGVVGSYSRFIADDYCSAGIANRFGILRAVWYWYLNWTGRYAASALDAIFGVLGPSVTPFVAPLVIILWTAVTAALLVIGSAEEPRRALPASILLASALIVATLELSPSVAQSLYWGQGMRSIVSPLILSAMYLGLLMWYSHRSSSAAQMRLLLACSPLLAFFMGGLNETFTALELSSLLFSLLLMSARGSGQGRSSIRRFLLAGVLGAAAALVVVVGAPGNVFRQVYYPPQPGLAGILSIALSSFGAYVGWLASSPGRWPAIIGAVAVAGYVGLRRPGNHVRGWQAPITLAVGLGFSYLCFLPAAYGLSDRPPDRTLMIPSFILVITAMLAAFTAGRRIAQCQKASSQPRWEAALLVLALATAVPSSASSDLRLYASQPSFARYAAHWDKTNAQILRARSAGENEIWIQSIPNWAGLDEPNDNPKYWVNVCYEQYYGIQVLAEGQP
jgi:Family of unknown function (DUF6056)